jgi:Putative transposase
MRLPASEFVRRLLLHVVPRGFVRIRHYGLWSNRQRREDLALCRRLLEGDAAQEAESLEPEKCSESLATVAPTRSCPNCGAARMIVIGEFPPLSAKVEQIAGADACVVVDSS